MTSVPLPEPSHFYDCVQDLARVLQTENRKKTEEVSQKLLSSLTETLGISPVRIKVLSKRPSRSWGELHGLYEFSEDGVPPTITVWMRTAQRRQVVAFKTFLRTILHELGHHLDYKLLGLEDSLHTEGFYKRESSLLHQLFIGFPEKGNQKNH